MTWKIRVVHIDDKTSECLASEAVLTDEHVELSYLDALDLAFGKITAEMVQRLKENA